MNRSLWVVLFIVLGSCLLWLILARRPMLLHVKLGPLQSDRRLVVWNPFRNKEPERFGAQSLTAIQSPRCREAVSKLDMSDEERLVACEKQERRPLVGLCSLVERRDKGDTVWLLFQCPQEAHPDVLADVGLSLRQRGSKWMLEGYERIY